MGKREMKMTETILKNNLPQEYRAVYETKGVYNTIRNSFVPESETSTRYIAENTFKFEGFMKFIGFTMPGAFKKQSMKYLTSFKNFVEKQNT
ncbi:hypothetical protein [Flavobacterium litorale]|uniref:hypothetical protein n=1 Tax=Flavobacterium litorale TaxID=2856519 RepID=UPI002107FC72|nr:hypothetical protein [Flavobacterium litorale]